MLANALCLLFISTLPVRFCTVTENVLTTCELTNLALKDDPPATNIHDEPAKTEDAIEPNTNETRTTNEKDVQRGKNKYTYNDLR